jgi:hypothetical protein
VTGQREDDEALRRAFQSLAETSPDALSPADVEDVWRAVTGDLRASQRRELVDRMAANPALAEAWRAAQELWREAQPTVASKPSRIWPSQWLAAAAVLVLGVGVGLVLQQARRGSEDTFRDANTYAVESRVATDAVLPRDDVTLRWTPGPEGTRYQVRVTTEDLRVITIVSDLIAPELVVDRGALTGVPAGGRVFWQVEATLPGGASASSQTFSVRVQ